MEISLVVLLIAVVGMSVYSSRQNKKRQQEATDFKDSLQIGSEVMTGSGLIGKILEKDDVTKTFVIESEGSKSRWLQDAITKMPPKPEELVSAEKVSEETKEITDVKTSEDDFGSEEFDSEALAVKTREAIKRAKKRKKSAEEKMSEEAELLTDEDRQEFEENDGLDKDDDE